MSKETMQPERYQLRRQLAVGGMATVHLAHDTNLDRPVALKVLSERLAADPLFVDRFRREAQSAGRLRHPNVVTVYDWGPFGGSYYIAMEYVEGRTLDQVLAQDGPLPAPEAARIGRQILEGLDAAHQQGLIHRDVKPSNVLLTPSGQIKIADFGIARAARVDIDLTQVGLVIGTAAYLSPEQAAGQAVDARSDFYALGVLLFELTTGQRPFAGDTSVVVATKHISTPAPRLRSITPSTPARLDDIVARLLAKDPADRYQTARALARELRAVEAGEAVGDEEPLATLAASGTPPPADAAHSHAGLSPAEPTAPPLAPTKVMPESARPDRQPAVAAPVTAGRGGSSGLAIILAALLVVGLVVVLLLLGSGLGSRFSDDPGSTSTTAPSTTSAPSSTETSLATVVVVPDLRGRSRTDAEAELSGVGLSARVETTEVDDPGEVGRVVGQDLAPGQEVAVDSTVVVRVGIAASTTTTTVTETSTTQASSTSDTTAPTSTTVGSTSTSSG